MRVLSINKIPRKNLLTEHNFSKDQNILIIIDHMIGLLFVIKCNKQDQENYFAAERHFWAEYMNELNAAIGRYFYNN